MSQFIPQKSPRPEFKLPLIHINIKREMRKKDRSIQRLFAPKNTNIAKRLRINATSFKNVLKNLTTTFFTRGTPTKTPPLFKQTLEANQTNTTDTKLIFPRQPTGWISTRPIQAINNNKREAKREVVPEASQYQPTSSS